MKLKKLRRRLSAGVCAAILAAATLLSPAGVSGADKVRAAGSGDSLSDGDSLPTGANASGCATIPITIRDYAADGMFFEWNEATYSSLQETHTVTSANQSIFQEELAAEGVDQIPAVGDSFKVNQGQNTNFALCVTDGKTHINNLTTSASIAGTTLYNRGRWGSAEIPEAQIATLGSGVTENVYGAKIRTGLVDSVLDEDKNLTYTKAVVDYLAGYLQKMLDVKFFNDDGTYNIYHIMGSLLDELDGKELSDVIRSQIGKTKEKYVASQEAAGGAHVTGAITSDAPTDEEIAAVLLGDYASSKSKFEAGNLTEATQIETYYDAAYFLLHNLYEENTGYGKTISEYKNINLVPMTNEDGSTYYVFNSGYNDTVYDADQGVIYNSQTEKADYIQKVRGNSWYKNTFDPVKELGYGIEQSRYHQLLSQTYYTNFYDKSNYDFTLEGHAQFLYYADDDLFFTFTGDDDVYLYINDVLVMDMGSAHETSRTSIDINDMAEQLGLRDGESYDFDFYYMERHGVACNFGIETNLRLMDSSMVTGKTGFQNGAEVGYGGTVDLDTPMDYQFQLKDDGDLAIKNLTFDDEKLGISLSKDEVTLNKETNLEDLVVTKIDAGGQLTLSLTGPSESELKNILAEGLEVGEQIRIYGFRHTILESEWDDANNYINTVHTTATAMAVMNTDETTLYGMAEYKVTRPDYDYASPHYYDWGTLSDTGDGTLSDKSAGITIEKDDLIKTVTDAGGEVTSDTAKIIPCSADGKTDNAGNINSGVSVDADGTLTYHSTVAGADSFYYLVKTQNGQTGSGAGTGSQAGTSSGTKTYGPVRVTVYTYGVADNVYVLDYGLPVELYQDDVTAGSAQTGSTAADSEGVVRTGLCNNDILTLGGLNPNETVTTYIGISGATSNYGTFASVTLDASAADSGDAADSLVYTPEKIMNGKDTVQVGLQIMEKGAKELTPSTGVMLTQTVTVVPASVVYYEDTYNGLTYISEDGNSWALYEAYDIYGNPVTDLMQTADQESDYGSDPAYEEDLSGTLTLVEDADGDGEQDLSDEDLDKYAGTLSGDASGGSLHVLDVDHTADVMTFSFTGTGVEIVSRTTAEAYAVLSVKIQNTETNEIVKQYPVITQLTNGDLSQVPIISVTGLDFANYQVTLTAAKSANTTADRVLYIDGVRIYGPLGKEEEELYYSADEVDTTYTEVKSLIKSGNMLLADINSDSILVSGETVVEDTEADGFSLKATDDPEEYLSFGPNNELYLDGADGISLVACYLVPESEDSADEAGASDVTDASDGTVVSDSQTVQIGAHRKSDSFSGASGDVTLVYGSTAEDIQNETNKITVESGTEQYYQIDLSTLSKDSDGRYLLLLGTTGSMNDAEILALTKVKTSGFTIEGAEAELTDSVTEEADGSADSVLSDAKVSAPMLLQIQSLMQSTRGEEEEEAKPAVNPDLHIFSAKLKSQKVVAGKTVTLLATADLLAQDVVVQADNGAEVTCTKKVRSEKSGRSTYTLTWTAEGTAGESQEYSIYVLDENGARSEEEQTVRLTIK